MSACVRSPGSADCWRAKSWTDALAGDGGYPAVGLTVSARRRGRALMRAQAQTEGAPLIDHAESSLENMSMTAAPGGRCSEITRSDIGWFEKFRAVT